MDAAELSKIIKEHIGGHSEYLRRCRTAERYYRNDNDILYTSAKSRSEASTRNADNRIPRNFHSLLVNQKAAYLFTAPPLYDVGDKEVNKQVAEILGDDYVSTCSELCVNASNKAVGWLHYWIDINGGFQYSPVDSEGIIPIFSPKLKKGLEAVIRNYVDKDEQGRTIIVWEYWNDTECRSFIQRKEDHSYKNLEEYCIFQDVAETRPLSNQYVHRMGEIPFIPFYNNNIHTDDLQNIKKLIDAYDKVFSGFLNDLEDIQEVIFVLTNYGGEGDDLDTFLQKLNQYKVVQIENAGSDDKSGVQTINIEIPVEARKAFLDMARKAIFEQGQGVDPNPEKFGAASGEALKYLYSLLELKAGFTEMKFRPGFGKLVRAICRYLGYRCSQVTQTWTRTAITNDKELAEIASMSSGITSNRSALRYHPNVDNVDEEMEQIRIEKAEEEKERGGYKESFAGGGPAGEGTGDGEEGR